MKGNHGEIWRKNIPGRENIKCRGPEAGTDRACSRNSRKTRCQVVAEGVTVHAENRGMDTGQSGRVLEATVRRVDSV